MFASKGIWTVEASGSKLGREESRQRRGAERQRYRTSFCRYQGNISQRQTKRLLFCGENQMLEGMVGVQRETAAKFREKGKSGGQFGLRWGRKSGTKSFEGGVNRFGRLEKFLPLRCRKFLHSFVAKSSKRQWVHFCFALGSSALPLAAADIF